MPAKKTTLGPVDLRRWARAVYPMLDGMSPRRVRKLRRDWLAACAYLGPKWRATLRRARKNRQAPPVLLHVVGGIDE